MLPHPDDEVYPMSGTLSKHVEEGAEITYICLTLGEMGRNLGNPPFANRVTLPQVRLEELKESCRIIGIQNLRLLGLHDKTIEFEPYEYLDEKIKEIMDEVNPEVIYTFYPGYGVHPDHNACGAAVIRIVSNILEADRPIVRCTAFPIQNDLGDPEIINDVTSYVKQKMKCLEAHSSQFRIPEKSSSNSQEMETFMQKITTERFWIYPF